VMTGFFVFQEFHLHLIDEGFVNFNFFLVLDINFQLKLKT